jgi:triosephosphate isomerase
LTEKVNAVLEQELKVIFCVGEPLEIRDLHQQNEYVRQQIHGALFHLGEIQFRNIIIAYEPVWAIGTGRTASAEQAQEMHTFIRTLIFEKYGEHIASETSLLYGGSCKPDNASALFSQPDVDGGLIGGAALNAADFKAIIQEL